MAPSFFRVLRRTSITSVPQSIRLMIQGKKERWRGGQQWQAEKETAKKDEKSWSTICQGGSMKLDWTCVAPPLNGFRHRRGRLKQETGFISRDRNIPSFVSGLPLFVPVAGIIAHLADGMGKQCPCEASTESANRRGSNEKRWTFLNSEIFCCVVLNNGGN